MFLATWYCPSSSPMTQSGPDRPVCVCLCVSVGLLMDACMRACVSVLLSVCVCVCVHMSHEVPPLTTTSVGAPYVCGGGGVVT